MLYLGGQLFPINKRFKICQVGSLYVPQFAKLLNRVSQYAYANARKRESFMSFDEFSRYQKHFIDRISSKGTVDVGLGCEWD